MIVQVRIALQPVIGYTSNMIQQAKDIQKPLARKLLAWYRNSKRDLPWRHTSNPYAIWVSEIMLQQTQVETVIPFFERFMKNFPSVEVLAGAPLSSVLKAWENLGYYSRARHLHEAARIVLDDFGGLVPDDPLDLLKLPGIGAYTAGAIASIAFGRAVPAVDGNVRRILCRVFAVEKSPKDPEVAKSLEQLARELVPTTTPGDFNSAIMDLGAVLCRPKTPRCDDCPLKDLCRAKAGGLEKQLPLVLKRPQIPLRKAVCAVVFDADGRLLVVQRPATGLLAGLWKLPGGFLSNPKDAKGDLTREVKAELGIEIHPVKMLVKANHVFTHFRLALFAYEARWTRGQPAASGCQSFLWVRPSDLESLAISKVDRKILSRIAEHPR